MAIIIVRVSLIALQVEVVSTQLREDRIVEVVGHSTVVHTIEVSLELLAGAQVIVLSFCVAKCSYGCIFLRDVQHGLGVQGLLECSHIVEIAEAAVLRRDAVLQHGRCVAGIDAWQLLRVEHIVGLSFGALHHYRQHLVVQWWQHDTKLARLAIGGDNDLLGIVVVCSARTVGHAGFRHALNSGHVGIGGYRPEACAHQPIRFLLGIHHIPCVGYLKGDDGLADVVLAKTEA